MCWPGVGRRARNWTNCVDCWTNMKGAGDDESDDESNELAFPEPDVPPGLDPAALSVARHGLSRLGRGSDGALSNRLCSLCARRGNACVDARRAGRYLLLSGALERS